MCDICNGTTLEDNRRLIRERIAQHGWTAMGVEADRPWLYTIGLLETFGHPELVTAGTRLSGSLDVIADLVDQIEQGAVFAADGSPAIADGLAVAFGRVHPRQWERSTFAVWQDHYASLGDGAPTPEAIQVLLPPDVFCSHHRQGQPTLANPLVDLTREPNRAERRASTKARRRRRRLR